MLLYHTVLVLSDNKIIFTSFYHVSPYYRWSVLQSLIYLHRSVHLNPVQALVMKLINVQIDKVLPWRYQICFLESEIRASFFFDYFKSKTLTNTFKAHFKWSHVYRSDVWPKYYDDQFTWVTWVNTIIHFTLNFLILLSNQILSK